MKALFFALIIISAPLFAKSTATVNTLKTKTLQTQNAAIIPTDKLNVKWWKDRHEQKIAQAKKIKCDLLFIGDSITHGWESAGKKVWETYYSKRNPFNLGFSGDRTEHVLWRFAHGELDKLQPKVAVIMIGTNNTGQKKQKAKETAEGIKVILQKFRQYCPKTQVLLLAVFPRGATPNDPMRKLNDQVNQIIKKYDDGKTVHYLDISSTFLDKKGNLSRLIMPDLLHPQAHGYKLWADAIEPYLKKLLGEK